jgi:hypothetical protein
MTMLLAPSKAVLADAGEKDKPAENGASASQDGAAPEAVEAPEAAAAPEAPERTPSDTPA